MGFGVDDDCGVGVCCVEYCVDDCFFVVWIVEDDGVVVVDFCCGWV